MLKKFAGLIEHGSRDEQLLNQIDGTRIPRHVAVIMDGNGRWARRRHLPRIAGHRSGVEAVRSTVETAARVGLHALTLYAFSAENYARRPGTEVSFLMRLLRKYLKEELPTLMRNNVRLDYIGRTHDLPSEVQRSMRETQGETAGNSGMTLTLALNYGARSELVDAFR